MIPTNLVDRNKNTGYEKFEIDEKRPIVKNVLLVINLYTVPLRREPIEHTLMRTI